MPFEILIKRCGQVVCAINVNRNDTLGNVIEAIRCGGFMGNQKDQTINLNKDGKPLIDRSKTMEQLGITTHGTVLEMSVSGSTYHSGSGPQPQPLLIYVYVPSIDKQVACSVLSNDNIGKIKLRYQSELMLDGPTHFLYNEQILDDAATFEQYHFRNKSVIQLVPQIYTVGKTSAPTPTGPNGNNLQQQNVTFDDMVVKVKSLKGETFGVSVSRNNTVWHLKERIRFRRGIPTEDQELTFRGKKLENNQNLSGLMLHDGELIHLMLVHKS